MSLSMMSPKHVRVPCTTKRDSTRLLDCHVRTGSVLRYEGNEAVIYAYSSRLDSAWHGTGRALPHVPVRSPCHVYIFYVCMIILTFIRA